MKMYQIFVLIAHVCVRNVPLIFVEFCLFFLRNMVGLEYILLHVQEPILYVIRKQHRHSPQQGKLISVSLCKIRLINE